MNQKIEKIKSVPPEQFIDEVCCAIRAGYGIVPFVGSGMSSYSGVLMGMEFTEYLTWTVYCCVTGGEGGAGIASESHSSNQTEPAAGVESGRPALGRKIKKRQNGPASAREEAPISPRDPWNLRERGWPPVPSAAQVKCARKWVRETFSSLCRTKYHLQVLFNDDFKPASDNANVPKDERESDQVVSISYMTGEVVADDQNEQPGGFPSPPTLNASLRRPLIPDIIKGRHRDKYDFPVHEFWRLVGREKNYREYEGTRSDSPTSQAFLEEAAIRALADWRSALTFLSCLHWGNTRAYIGKSDPYIIDSFNTHITRGRKPNLGHQMLCHLARPARIRCILTTNFDTLIEDAFDELNFPFRVISVSTHGALPHPDTIHSLHCIIKMHGAFTETRADFSLDDPPTSEDKRRFANFVWGGIPTKSPEPAFLPAYLLVCGYSASDMRCVQMIKHYLDICPTGKVFWICYCQADFDNLRDNIFPESEYPSRVCCTIRTRVDLLFNELYQHLTLCLPEGGFSYQFFPNVPPGIEESVNMTPNGGARNDAKYGDARKILSELQKRDKRYVICNFSSGAVSALRPVFYNPARINATQSIWFELEDYISPRHVAHELMQIIALRLGRYQLDHYALAPLWKEKSMKRGDESLKRFADWLKNWIAHIRLQLRLWNQDPSQWLLIFYARNSIGGCSGWEQRYWRDDSDLCKLFETLAEAGFPLVYSPYSEDRRWRDLQKQEAINLITEELHDSNRAVKEWREMPSCAGGGANARAELTQLLVDEKEKRHCPAVHNLPKTPARMAGLIHPPYAFSPNHHVTIINWVAPLGKGEKAKEWKGGRFEEILKFLKGWIMGDSPGRKNAVNERFQRRIFLYACTLMRQSRQYSAFFSDALTGSPSPFNRAGFDNDWHRSIDLKELLNTLSVQHHRVFEKKPGGFLWMYRDVRLGLRQMLERTGSWDTNDPDHAEEGYALMREVRSGSHYWIADWYTRVFLTTGHAVPFLESLYHFAQAALSAHFARRKYKFPGKENKSNSPEEELKEELKVFRYQIGQWRISVFRLIKSLRIGRPTMQFWIQEATAELWFGLDEQPGGDRKLIDALANGFEAHIKPWEARRIDGAHADEIGKTIHAYRELWKCVRSLLEAEFNACYNLARDRPQLLASRFSIPIPTARDEDMPQVGEDADIFKWIPALVLAETARNAQSNQRYIAELFASFEKEQPWFAAPREGNSWKSILKGMLDSAAENAKTPDEAAGRKIEIATQQAQRSAFSPFADLSISFIEFLVELTYALIRMGKLWQHAKRGDLESNDPELHPHFSVPQAVETWLQVCVLCRFILRACPYLSPQHWHLESRILIRTLTYYGLALGRLGRFFEAHRRLNEANALLSKTTGLRDGISLAEIKIRRAEVHLLEARHLRWMVDEMWRCGKDVRNFKEGKDAHGKGAAKGKQIKLTPLERAARSQWVEIYLENTKAAPPKADMAKDGAPLPEAECPIQRLHRLHLARLDEAWGAIEGAERLLSGHSQSRIWWSRLHALQLRLIDEHQYGAENGPYTYTLAFRRRYLMEDQVREYFIRGVVAAPRDEYRYTRLLDYLLGAMRTAVAVDKRTLALSEFVTSELVRALEKTFDDYSLRETWVYRKFSELARGIKTTPRDGDLLKAYVFRVCEKYEAVEGLIGLLRPAPSSKPRRKRR